VEAGRVAAEVLGPSGPVFLDLELERDGQGKAVFKPEEVLKGIH